MSYSVPVSSHLQTSQKFTIHEINSDNLGLIFDLLKEENAKLQRQADDYEVVLNYMNESERQHFLNVVKLHRYGIELEKRLPPPYDERKGQVLGYGTTQTDVKHLYHVVRRMEEILEIPHRFIMTNIDNITRIKEMKDIKSLFVQPVGAAAKRTSPSL